MEKLDMDLREESIWSGTPSYRLAPSRCEIHFKVCLSLIASVIISTAVSVMVVHHLLGPPVKVSCAEKQSGYQMLGDDRQTQKFQPEQKYQPYAHLTVAKPPSKKQDFVCWNKPTKNYIGGGMKYNDNDSSLLIPETGLYVIYLQVSYRSVDKFNACTNGVVHLKQSVTVLKTGYISASQEILTNWETVSCDKDVWFKTIPNMARVLLYKGDRLQVTLRSDFGSLIDVGGKPGTKTFWGVYLDRSIN